MEEQYEAYCMKCKKKHVMVEAEQTKTKNGKNAVKGKCKECGTKMFKFIK